MCDLRLKTQNYVRSTVRNEQFNALTVKLCKKIVVTDLSTLIFLNFGKIFGPGRLKQINAICLDVQ